MIFIIGATGNTGSVAAEALLARLGELAPDDKIRIVGLDARTLRPQFSSHRE